MNYVTHAELVADVLKWERQLPQYDYIVGVPRSGLIPAALLALRRNVRMLDLATLLHFNPSQDLCQLSHMRSNNPSYGKSPEDRILVVDDSSSDNSVTLSSLRERLRHLPFNIDYAAVYRASPASKVDYYYREIPQPRIFEWNWFRHHFMTQTILDIDGVLCEDWTGLEQDGNDPVYLSFIRDTRPLFLPEHPVLGLCTSRLERYRQHTEVWLHRYGVRYQHLRMYPGRRASERRNNRDGVIRKADYYRLNQNAQLFVESDKRQAAHIVELAGKPVLCTDTNSMMLP